MRWSLLQLRDRLQPECHWVVPAFSCGLRHTLSASDVSPREHIWPALSAAEAALVCLNHDYKDRGASDHHPTALNCWQPLQPLINEVFLLHWTELAAMETFSLTVELISSILQYVPQQQRLRHCALVSRCWHAAAVAATTTISAKLPVTDKNRCDSMSSWLQKYGSHTTSLALASNLSPLHLDSSGRRHLQLQKQLGQLQDLHVALPSRKLQQLQDLQITLMRVEVDSIFEKFLSSYGSLTALTSLRLEGTYISLHSLASLQQLSGLQRLQLIAVAGLDNSSNTLGVFIGGFMRHWTGLTALSLNNCFWRMDASALSCISCLTQLQRLELQGCHVTTDVVNMLPLGLSHLQLSVKYSDIISPQTTPSLCAMTSLRHLEVDEGRVDPGLLHRLVQLQHLSLRNWSSSLETAEALLTLLHSSLTFLDLTGCWLQAHTLQQMFTPEQQFPALQVLHLGMSWCSEDWDYEVPDYQLLDGGMGRLVRSCPGLTGLALLGVLHPKHWQQLSALAQLTALNTLALGGDVVSDSSILLLHELQLTGLRDLQLIGSRRHHASEDTLTATGVVLLRKLTQLTRLSADMELNEYDRWKFLYRPPSRRHVELISEVSPPDVWKQIEHAFAGDTAMTGEMLQAIATECEDAVNSAKTAEEQVQALQQETKLLKQQVQFYKQHLQSAQEQLKATQEGWLW